MLSKRIASVALAVLGISLYSGTASGQAPESSDPILLSVNDWTGVFVSSHIMGGILESMGYNVEYRQVDYFGQWPALKTGDLTASMEIWGTTAGQVLKKELATGKVVDLGETGMNAIEEWWYPLYAKDKCPELPDWRALLKEDCAASFATVETSPKGRYVGGPAGWGGFDEERIEALGLPFVAQHPGSDTAMFAELEAAYQRKTPIILWVWSPHWAPSKYDGEWVEFPKYTDACYEDPGWGMNPNQKYDCGKPRGWIKKVAWAEGEKKWPCAYEAMRKYTMDDATMSSLISKVDLDGETIEGVAKEWVDNNKSVWGPWASCSGN
jgi:glycine betaine/proline transport system substrate-binding protein